MKDTKERLDGWKQIAQYLHRDVTTVIRWEREKGLPVQRIPGGKRQSVFAYREDIDHWLSRPCQNGNPPPIGYDAPFVSERVENASSPSETAFNVAPEIAQGLNEQTGSGNPLPTGKTSDPLNKQEFPHAEFLIPQSSLLSPRGLLTRLLVPLLVCLVGTGAASWVLFFRWPSSIPKISKITAITNDGVEKGLLPFTDGSRIYFEESFPAKGAVKAVSTAGGDVIDIPMPIKNPFLVNIAPDGSGLLIANYYSPGPELWKVPLLGGSPRPVFGIHSVYVDWSPSRQKFVYVEDEGHTLSVAGLNGTGGQKLVTLSSQSISSPRWSPDGKIIRFVSTDPSHTGYMSELWEIESDGSKPRPLLAGWNSPPRESAGNWSVDGKFYVFSSQRDGRSDIWAIFEKQAGWFSRNAHKPVRLTNGPMDFFDPVPSSDGKKIFFYGRQPYGELVRYDPHSRTLSTFLLGISGGSVDFSPDGQWITYLSYPENTLWRSRVDGSERLELMFAPWEADSPHWSPDGKSIAFRAALPGHRRKIFLISRDGGDAQELLPERAEEDGVPTWSSDGRLIAFGDISWKLDDIALHVIDWRTRSVSTIAGSNGLWTARWSPDGRYIAALTRDSQSLLIYDFRSQQWRMLLHHFVEDPTWSHDGKYIYFRTNDHVNELSVFRVAITNGALERIWNFGAFPGIYPHPITLAPDDTILTTRDTHHIELYSLDVQEPLL